MSTKRSKTYQLQYSTNMPGLTIWSRTKVEYEIPAIITKVYVTACKFQGNM